MGGAAFAGAALRGRLGDPDSDLCAESGDADKDIVIGHQPSFRRSSPDNQPSPDIMPHVSAETPCARFHSVSAETPYLLPLG